MTAAMAHLDAAPAVEFEMDFDEFYAATFPVLSRQLFAYLGDWAEAQDTVQEAFCRAFGKWKIISSYQDPFAWVRRVAWNICTSRFRRLRTARKFLRSQREQYTDGPSPDRIVLVEALARIPAQLRKAMVLHYIAQLSIAEIAEQEDVAEGTVKSWLNRGRAALGKELAEYKEGADNV